MSIAKAGDRCAAGFRSGLCQQWVDAVDKVGYEGVRLPVWSTNFESFSICKQTIPLAPSTGTLSGRL
jgi:hypothetical protein